MYSLKQTGAIVKDWDGCGYPFFLIALTGSLVQEQCYNTDGKLWLFRGGERWLYGKCI